MLTVKEKIKRLEELRDLILKLDYLYSGMCTFYSGVLWYGELHEEIPELEAKRTTNMSSSYWFEEIMIDYKEDVGITRNEKGIQVRVEAIDETIKELQNVHT
jgi:hypothetical protein